MKNSEHNLIQANFGGGLTLPVTYRQLTTDEFQQAMQIRIQVFVEEQKVPLAEEQDSYDQLAQHFGVFFAKKLVGTGRLVLLPNSGKIGRVAILPEYRGRGFGRGLIKAILAAGQQQGIEQFELGAQLQALDFYAQLGFQVEGEVFLDGGIPHRTMRLTCRS